jgi:hypothetical protein
MKPNGQKKTCVCMTEFLPIQQSPGMMRPWEFAGEAFRNTALHARIVSQQIFILTREET